MAVGSGEARNGLTVRVLDLNSQRTLGLTPVVKNELAAREFERASQRFSAAARREGDEAIGAQAGIREFLRVDALPGGATATQP